MKIIGLLLISLTLVACATMNANECSVANWYEIGYEEGSRGYHPNRFTKHRKACAKHGFAANFSEYKAGHGKGVRTYCTPQQGYRLGKINSGFPSICPADLTANVRKGYDLGYDVFLEKQAIRREIEETKEFITAIDDEIEIVRKEYDESEKYLSLADEELKKPDITNSVKILLYTQRTQLVEKLEIKQAEMDELEAEKEPFYNSIKGLEEIIRQLDRKPMPALRY